MKGCRAHPVLGEGMPKVTIVMPVRDGAAYVAEAVDSVLRQTMPDFELIVVDDHSTDDGMAIVAACGAGDARVTIVGNPGSGIVDALNHGLAMARGPLIARMDGDDISMPQRLEVQVRQFEAREELHLLGTAGVAIGPDGTETGLIPVPLGHREIADTLRSRHNPILHPTTMFRTAAARRLGGYRQAFTYAEDYDLWLRFAGAGEIANLAEPLVRLRAHAGQVSTVRRDRQKAAAALARRAAQLRLTGASEPFDPASAPPDAIRAFLIWRSRAEHPIGIGECRDLELMARMPGTEARLWLGLAYRALRQAPSLRTLALAPRLAWHRLARR